MNVFDLKFIEDRRGEFGSLTLLFWSFYILLRVIIGQFVGVEVGVEVLGLFRNGVFIGKDENRGYYIEIR